MDEITRMDEIPEIYCAISIELDINANIELIRKKLCAIGVPVSKEFRPKYAAVTILEVAVVRYERFWEINDALTKMFSMIGNQIDSLAKIVAEHGGETYIAITVNDFGRLPALLFSGENMKRIHQLHANISIDIL